MNWSDYVGIPDAFNGRTRDGVDCWGLARLVMADAHGIDLESYSDELDSREVARIIGLMAGEFTSAPWCKVDNIQPFDFLWFKVGARLSHVGVAVNAREMLHVEAGKSSVIIPLDRWGQKITGIYRHEALI